jgi:parallel beta-helix repeat protein
MTVAANAYNFSSNSELPAASTFPAIQFLNNNADSKGMKNWAFLLAIAVFIATAWGAFYINNFGPYPNAAYYSTPYNATFCSANITNTSNVLAANYTLKNPVGSTIFSNINSSTRIDGLWNSSNFTTARFGIWKCTVDASNSTLTSTRTQEFDVDYPNDWPQVGGNKLRTGYSSQVAPPNGAQNWSFSAKFTVIGHITTAGGYAFVPATAALPAKVNSTMFVLNLTTGVQICNYTADSGVSGNVNLSAAAYGDSYIYFTAAGNASDTAVILFPNCTPVSITVATIASLEAPLVLGPNIIYSSPAYDNSSDKAVFSFENAKFVSAYSSKSIQSWTQKLHEQNFGGCIGGLLPAQNLSPTSPAISDGLVYVTGYNQSPFQACFSAALYALNITNGNVVWNTSIGAFSRSTPVVGNGFVYLLEANGNLTAFYSRNGSIAWGDSTILPVAAWQSSNTLTTVAPALANNTLNVFYGTQWKRYDAKSGASIATPVVLLPSVSTSMAISRNNQMALGAGKVLYVVDIGTGATTWSTDLGGSAVYSDPAMANGIFAGSDQGVAYGYGMNLTQYNCQDPATNCFSPNATWLRPNQSALENFSGTLNFNVSVQDVGYGIENATVYMMLFPAGAGPVILGNPVPGSNNVTPWLHMSNYSSGSVNAYNYTFNSSTLNDSYYTALLNSSDLLNNTNVFTFALFGIDNPPRCGQTLMENTTLVSNVSALGTCFIIGNSNITLDCDGYTISGIGTGYGVINPGNDNVTVKNCLINTFNYGIAYVEGAINGTILNDTVWASGNDSILVNASSNFTQVRFSQANVSNSESGRGALHINGSSHVLIANTSANATGTNAIRVDFGQNVTVANSTARAQSGAAIYFSYSNNATVLNSTGVSQFGAGFYAQYSNYTYAYLLRGSSTDGVLSTYGMQFSSSHFATIANATATSAVSAGIFIQSSNLTLLVNTTGTGSSSDAGISLSVSDNATITNCTAYSTSSGLAMLTSHNATISNTTIHGLTRGISLTSSRQNSIINSSITIDGGDPAYYVIYSSGASGNNTFANTTLNLSSIGWNTGANSINNNVTVKWYVNFTVDTINSMPISGADLNATPNFASQSLFNSTTDAQGDISALTEFIELFANGTFTYNESSQQNYTTYNNWTFYANKTGYTTNSTNSTINQSKTVAITLKAAGGDTTAPLVGIVSPTAFANLSGFQVINISANDTVPGVAFVHFRFENATGNATPWLHASLGSGDTNNGYWNYTFNTASIADGTYNITINATDGDGNANKTVNITVIIDNTPPQPLILSPLNNSTQGQLWIIRVNATDNLTGIRNMTFRVEHSGANITPWTYMPFVEGSMFNGTWQTTYDSASLANDIYTVAINSSDFAGSENSTVNSTFRRDVAGPGGGEPPKPPPGCNEPGGPECPPPPPCDPATDPACPPPPPPPCDPATDPSCGPQPCDPATDPSCQPPPPKPEPVCDFNSDCPGDMQCIDHFCAQVNGTCGFAFNHAWQNYQCCSDSMCGQGEYCNLATHDCLRKLAPPPPPPEGFKCTETCGIDGSGKCCSGYCEAGVCRLSPPAAAQAVTVLGGSVQLRSACAGLGLGLDEFSCNLIWVVQLILALLAGYAGERTRGRLAGAAMLLLPLFLGLVTYASVGVALSLFELFAILALKPRAH